MLSRYGVRISVDEYERAKELADNLFDGNVSRLIRVLIILADEEKIREKLNSDEVKHDFQRGGGLHLTNEEVAQLRSLRAEGWTQVRLAEKFRVSQVLVSQIVRGNYRRQS
jgi:hypothetical protein